MSPEDRKLWSVVIVCLAAIVIALILACALSPQFAHGIGLY